MDEKEANAITGSRIIRCAIVRRSRSSNVQSREPLMNVFYFDILPRHRYCKYRGELSKAVRRKKLKIHLLSWLWSLFHRFNKNGFNCSYFAAPK